MFSNTAFQFGLMGLRGLSAIAQYKADKTAAAYAERIGEVNAEMLRREAAAKRREGEIAAGQFKKQGEQVKGAQRAGYGASGVLMSEGSAAWTILSTEDEIEYDAKLLKSGFDAEVTSLLNRGEVAAWQGRTEGAARRATAPLGLLTGAADIAGMYSRMR